MATVRTATHNQGISPDSSFPKREKTSLIFATRKRFWFAALLGFAILFYTIRQADLTKLAQSLEELSMMWVLAMVLASASSYLCIAAVLDSLLKNTGQRIPFFSTLKISLISCTLNYLMAIGGLSGVAAKVYLLSREKIPPSKTLSISMVHGFLTNTVAVLFVYIGFFSLSSEYPLKDREMELGIIILIIAFLLTWITIQTIVHEAFRKKLWRLAMTVADFLSEKLRWARWFNRNRAETFFENFNDSMNLLLRNIRQLWAPALFALLDWMLMFACLKFAFMAVHYPIDNSTLLVGFSVGIFAGLFSFIPASIGLMEGSMAGAFYLMGLDYDQALLATLLYRLVYFFLPIMLSVFFYRQFFKAPLE